MQYSVLHPATYLQIQLHRCIHITLMYSVHISSEVSTIAFKSSEVSTIAFKAYNQELPYINFYRKSNNKSIDNELIDMVRNC